MANAEMAKNKDLNMNNPKLAGLQKGLNVANVLANETKGMKDPKKMSLG